MNTDILKGKWQEIKGRTKERWGILTANDLYEIEGKEQKLLGILQKKYGYIRDKAQTEYRDRVELARIVSNIRAIMIKNNDTIAIAAIARYGQPLLGKNQENPTGEKENKYGNHIDRYSYSRLSRRTTYLAPQ